MATCTPRALVGAFVLTVWFWILRFLSRVAVIFPVRLFVFDAEAFISNIERKFGRKLSLAKNPIWIEGLRLAASKTNTECPESMLVGRWNRKAYVEWNILRPLLIAEAALARHPDISSVPISKPIFISGTGRNGSTLLQDIMCCYPSVRYLTIPDCMDIAPLDESREFDPVWRQERQELWRDNIEIHQRSIMNLGQNSHMISDKSPEECIVLLSKYLFWFPLLTFDGNCDGVEWSLSQPAFTRKAYEMYKQELKLLLYYDQKIDGIDPSTVQFVLKAPLHVVYHDVIRKVFPDAIIIRLHRDPVEVTASFCSMFTAIHKAYPTRHDHDPTHLGKMKLKWVLLACNRMVEEGVGEGMIDVRYLDFKKDPVGTSAKIAAAVGLEHNEDVEQKITTYLKERRRQPQGTNPHNPALYGLNPTAIRQDLSSYCEMFRV
ncbi:uncharacterized protein LOC134184713 [Corticium candelabrum]|uniref:uncharacterized protein LOC134184713 n=1 Tax=Corticium candelabrum TaxID=121492 RepID=UPI002E378830|nr:uncharacterized protein LOC134184713 [Corticium candelabrum]